MASKIVPQPGVRTFVHRAERHVPREGTALSVEVTFEDGQVLEGRLGDISASGMACLFESLGSVPPAETRVTRARIGTQDGVRAWAAGILARGERVWIASEPTDLYLLAIAFDTPQPALVESLLDHLAPSPYVSDALLMENSRGEQRPGEAPAT